MDTGGKKNSYLPQKERQSSHLVPWRWHRGAQEFVERGAREPFYEDFVCSLYLLRTLTSAPLLCVAQEPGPKWKVNRRRLTEALLHTPSCVMHVATVR